MQYFWKTGLIVSAYFNNRHHLIFIIEEIENLDVIFYIASHDDHTCFNTTYCEFCKRTNVTFSPVRAEMLCAVCIP